MLKDIFGPLGFVIVGSDILFWAYFFRFKLVYNHLIDNNSHVFRHDYYPNNGRMQSGHIIIDGIGLFKQIIHER